MLSPQHNQLLTDVEGEAPMGRMMRESHWIPCALSETLVVGGAPKRVKLLGESYVAFRADDGRVGFLDEACPHRGVSLVLARTEGCALRCIFHAWKIDISGQVVEVPSEGERSAEFAKRVKTRSYPTFEGGGLVWVFLGAGAPPQKPPLPFLDLPAENCWVSRTVTPCNWLQGVEGTIDSIHVGVLHKSWIADLSKAQQGSALGFSITHHPKYEVEDTAYGVRAAAIRTLDDGREFLRVTEYVMPFVSLVPGGMTDRKGSMFISVPIDNVSHMLFWGFWNEDGPNAYDPNTQVLDLVGMDIENFANAVQDADGAWGQNRAAMAQGHFSGFDRSLLGEDVVVQASMGPIVDRSKEHLCSSDVAIVAARMRLLEALTELEVGTASSWNGGTVRPLDTVADAGFDWRGKRAVNVS